MRTIIAHFAFLAFLFSSSQAGENIYLELSINGNAVSGETSVNNIDGIDVSNQIECHAFQHEVFRTVNASGQLSGPRQHKPITITKKIDKASPLLLQAVSQGSSVTATFRFFRNNPDIEALELQQKITIVNARIVRLQRWQPNNLEPAGAALPTMEEVSFLFDEIIISDEIHDIEYTDTDNGGA